MVVHVAWGPLPVPPSILSDSEDVHSPLPPMDADERWFHCALQYDQPQRTTLIGMERDAWRDDGELLGVRASKHPTLPREMHDVTIWEALGDHTDFQAEDIAVTFFQLVARPGRAAPSAVPGKQRVRKFGLTTFHLRSMKKPPKKRTTAGRGRGRGRAPIRRGRGRPAEGLEGDAGAIEDGDDGTSSSSSTDLGVDEDLGAPVETDLLDSLA